MAVYPTAAVERAMKVQEVILKAMATDAGSAAPRPREHAHGGSTGTIDRRKCSAHSTSSGSNTSTHSRRKHEVGVSG